MRLAASRLSALLLPLFASVSVAACGSSSSSTPPPRAASAPPPSYYGPGPYAPAPAYSAPPPYAAPPPSQGGWAPAPAPAPTYRPAPAPAPQAPAPATPPSPAAPQAPNRPLLAPLVGTVAWQAEVKSVLGELIAHLSAANAAKVRGIPLVFDPNPYEINAYAGCNEKGEPFLAATEGLLEAVDAVAQTRATDDLFGTQTYDAYSNAVLPRLAQSDKASAALPLGIIPMNLVADPRRLSHAHEWFDDLVAFTFGHELAHHYLGHTGCANGQTFGAAAQLGYLVTQAVPTFNQPMEAAADGAGIWNVLDTGRARLPAYAWSERGALGLLDFFGRMERAAGMSPLNPIGILRSHPNPAFRIPLVQSVAATWHAQHP